jgi:hypothetical protein
MFFMGASRFVGVLYVHTCTPPGTSLVVVYPSSNTVRKKIEKKMRMKLTILRIESAFQWVLTGVKGGNR